MRNMKRLDQAIEVYEALGPLAKGTAIQSMINGEESKIHGSSHVEQVWLNALGLYAMLPDEADVDPVVLAIFARLHDCKRVDDGADPEHGTRAANMAVVDVPHSEIIGTIVGNIVGGHWETGAMRAIGWAAAAMDGHSRGMVSEVNHTTGVCWDADRLELTRFGVEVMPEKQYLSTEPAKVILDGFSVDMVGDVGSFQETANVFAFRAYCQSCIERELDMLMGEYSVWESISEDG